MIGDKQKYTDYTIPFCNFPGTNILLVKKRKEAAINKRQLCQFHPSQ